MSQFFTLAIPSDQIFTTVSTGVIVKPFDVSNYKEATFGFRNSATAAMLSIKVQANHFPSNTDGWAEITTTTLPTPSAIGVGAQTYTSAVLLSHKWLRVTGHVANSANTGIGALTITLAGRGA